MKTIEDTLTEGVVVWLGLNWPVGLPRTWPVYHARREGARRTPCVVVGDEGCRRESGMPDTGRVALRVMVLTDKDQVTGEVHRAVCGVVEGALDGLLAAVRGYDAGGEAVEQGQPVPGCHVHDLMLEPAERGHDPERRQDFTVLKRAAVVSRYAGETDLVAVLERAGITVVETTVDGELVLGFGGKEFKFTGIEQ